MRKLGILTTSAVVSAGLATALAVTPAVAAPGDTCDALLFLDQDDSEVWFVDDDGTDAFDIGSAFDGHADPTLNEKPTWSPDGDQFAWSAYDGDSQEIHIADSDGGNRQDISDLDLAGDEPTDNHDPAFSAEGDQLAWSGHDGTTHQIFVANTDGTARTTISDVDSGTDPTGNDEPTWSAEGDKIAWVGHDGSTTQIYVSDVDGTNRVAISAVDLSGDEPTANEFPQFSPDGTQIAWMGSDGSTFQIYVANVNGTERYAISDVDLSGDEPFDNAWPRWAPDSDAITWSGDDGATDQIFVASTSLGGVDRTTISDVDSGTDPLSNWDPVFSPSGTRIAWSGMASGIRRLIVADADGTNRTIFTSANSGAEWPEWQPRRASISLSSTTTSDLQLGDTGQTVLTAESDCSVTDVEIDLDVPACWGFPGISTSAGSYDYSTWTIPVLDGSETLTLSGTVSEGPNCDSRARVTNTFPGGSSTSKWIGTKAECDTAPTPFTDLADASYGHAQVACIYNLSITNGVDPTTYGHSQLVSRQQMAAFLARLYRAMGGECDYSDTPFDDIAGLSYGQQDIACIYNINVTKGISATTYGPAMSVSRQQMGVFLARLYQAMGGECNGDWTVLEDVQSLSWGTTHINCIYRLGITKGTSPTTYSPEQLVTRLQMGVFLANLWGVVTEQGLNTADSGAT